MKNYDDIINLPHHVSSKHPQMSNEARAAQFAPFAALTGYGDAVEETARITDYKVELDEDAKDKINAKLNYLNTHILEKPPATFTYFVPDKKKNGGSYTSISGNVRQIDLVNNIIILSNKKKINIIDLIDTKINDDKIKKT